METDKEILNQMQKDPSNWVWGIFYFNPKDKRVFPPKRTRQLGWTINFANPYSILAFVVLIGAFVLIYKFS